MLRGEKTTFSSPEAELVEAADKLGRIYSTGRCPVDVRSEQFAR
jgi:hypothetical protein